MKKKLCNQPREIIFHISENEPLNRAQFWGDGFDNRFINIIIKILIAQIHGLIFSITSILYNYFILFFTENIYTLRNFSLNINNQDHILRDLYISGREIHVGNIVKIEQYSLFGITCSFPPGPCKSVHECCKQLADIVAELHTKWLLFQSILIYECKKEKCLMHF